MKLIAGRASSLVFLSFFAMSCGDDIEALGDATGNETGNETGDTGDVAPLDLDALEEGEWTFVPNDNMVCMNGSTTGFGVRLKEGASKLLIHLEDGGACFNFGTCGGVFNKEGFLEPEMDSWALNKGENGIFDGINGPFADYSMVFVPYCGGDVHSGHTDDGFGGRTQQGYGNVRAVLDSIHPAFESIADKVILTGASAGALGVLLNYEQTAEKFGEIPVDVISDSGPVIGDEVLAPCLQQAVRDRWNINPSIPVGCTDCTGADGGGLTNIYEYLSSSFPERKFALLTTDFDWIFRLFYGFGANDCDGLDGAGESVDDIFAQGIYDWAERIRMLSNMNIMVFGGNNSSHVLTYSNLDNTSVNTSIRDWLTAFESGDAAWDDVIPPVAVPEEDE